MKADPYLDETATIFADDLAKGIKTTEVIKLSFLPQESDSNFLIVD